METEFIETYCIFRSVNYH